MLVGDGKILKWQNDTQEKRVAEWGAVKWGPEEGTLILHDIGLCANEVKQLVEFILVGPPKKKWKITREFDEKPDIVITGKPDKIEVSKYDSRGARIDHLTNKDVKEVWE
jgi:hypothetical protein